MVSRRFEPKTCSDRKHCVHESSVLPTELIGRLNECVKTRKKKVKYIYKYGQWIHFTNRRRRISSHLVSTDLYSLNSDLYDFTMYLLHKQVFIDRCSIRANCEWFVWPSENPRKFVTPSDQCNKGTVLSREIEEESRDVTMCRLLAYVYISVLTIFKQNKKTHLVKFLSRNLWLTSDI